jgi:hypothetical protein
MNQTEKSTVADNTGIASAILCTIHCLIVPLLFMIQTVVSSHITLPSWWGWVDYLFLIISFWAVFHSGRHTSNRITKTALWFFWIVLATAIVMEDKLHWLAYIASAGLIATHVRNIINIRRRQAEYNEIAV